MVGLVGTELLKSWQARAADFLPFVFKRLPLPLGRSAATLPHGTSRAVDRAPPVERYAHIRLPGEPVYILLCNLHVSHVIVRVRVLLQAWVERAIMYGYMVFRHTLIRQRRDQFSESTYIS
jgi:hypothetical protein